MKEFKIQNKKIYNIPYCQEQLRVNGFKGAILAVCYSNPPVTTVYEDDGAPDPTQFLNAYVDPGKIELSSNCPVGPSGFSECLADGVSVHKITVKKVNPETKQVISGSEMIKALPNQFVGVGPAQSKLKDGQIQLNVGPSSIPGIVSVTVRDVGNALMPAIITLAFV